MPEFLAQYGTEAQWHAAVVAMRWRDGFVCACCEGTRYSRFDRNERAYWQCSACRTQTTATCGTIFEDPRLPPTRWVLAMP
jgi:ribosomal protein L37AE/L43A